MLLDNPFRITCVYATLGSRCSWPEDRANGHIISIDAFLILSGGIHVATLLTQFSAYTGARNRWRGWDLNRCWSRYSCSRGGTSHTYMLKDDPFRIISVWAALGSRSSWPENRDDGSVCSVNAFLILSGGTDGAALLA